MKTDIPLTLRVDEDELNTLRDALVELSIAYGMRLEETEDEYSRAWFLVSMNRCRGLLQKLPINVGG